MEKVEVAAHLLAKGADVNTKDEVRCHGYVYVRFTEFHPT
jgi:hypothetical protein